jgi:hypothetical protein
MARYRLRISVGLALLFGLGAIFFADEECAGSERDWQQFQYNAQHIGYNPEARLYLPLVPKWSVRYMNERPLNQVSIAGDRVLSSFQTYSFDAGFTGYIVCLDTDGLEQWRKNFYDIYWLDQVSSVGGRVHAQVCRGSGGYVQTMDLTTGDSLWCTWYYSQASRFLAPTVYNGRLLLNGGTYGGLYALNSVTGTKLWFSALAMWNYWTPAAHGNEVYTFVNGVFQVWDMNTGLLNWRLTTVDSLKSTASPNIYDMKVAPLIDTTNRIAYLMWHISFQAIDLDFHQMIWKISGDFGEGINPAFRDGKLYTVESGRLAVYDALTGTFLWEYVPDGIDKTPFAFPPVISDRYVFVSSGWATYAVDLETHKSDWNILHGGYLSLSGDALYIGGMDGVLYAYGNDPTGIDDGSVQPKLPTEYCLYQNYPNPFNATTVIGFDLPRNSHVRIDLYNTLGQHVKTLIDAELSAGSQAAEWDGTDATNSPVASGTYLCRFKAGDAMQTKKVTLLK